MKKQDVAMVSIVAALSMLEGTTAQTPSATVVASNSGGSAAVRHKVRRNPPIPHPDPSAGPQFGNPLADLTADQQALFTAGREEFEAVETADSGLGPIFNGDSCAGCHNLSTTGGAGTTTELRFGRVDNGRFDPLLAAGGSLLQAKSIDPGILEVVPTRANVRALRLTTPLFGAGLIEAIPDATIQANAARRQPDGIGGRAAQVTDVVSGTIRVGRFGWKAQHATLLAFASDAYLNEIGITSRFFPTENAPNGNTALLAQFDKVPDPEDTVDPATGRSDIDNSTSFMRLLGAPPQQRTSRAAEQGRSLFAQIQCAACHLPSMTTGPSEVAALDHKVAWLYSDLLLHDMGRLGDGIEQAAAGQREMRTAPLWGLRARGPYLHDGRAATVAQAILAHDGEASAARDRFRRLSDSDQRALLEFLGSI